jgi:hypothetical protein
MVSGVVSMQYLVVYGVVSMHYLVVYGVVSMHYLVLLVCTISDTIVINKGKQRGFA